ncbi:hypothetical protein PGB90_002472 [Kerria lacca]
MRLRLYHQLSQDKIHTNMKMSWFGLLSLQNLCCYLFVIFISCLPFFHSVNTDRSDLIEKVRQLKDQSAKSYVLKLNNVKFRDYIKTPVKNYSFVVLFTAMASHRQCSVCSVVRDEFELTAKSFRITHGSISDRLFFGFVDFDQNSEIFRVMNVNSVPLIVYFPAKRKLQMKTDALDMQRYGYSAESITKWLVEKSGVDFRIMRPPFFFGTAGLLVLFFVGSIVIYFKCENFSILNRTIWGLTSIGFCLLMTSGQMWNHIRCPPFLMRAQDGGFSYVHPSSHGQFIGETYFILLLNAGITVSVIVLIDNGCSDSCIKRNKMLHLLCIVVAALCFNTLLSIFRTKAPNYPYKGFP